MTSASTTLILAFSLLLLASCRDEHPVDFARKQLPNVEFSEVLAVQQSHSGPYGCTFVIVRLKLTVSQNAPINQEVKWHPTPILEDINVDERIRCLTWSDEDLDGAGLHGYGEDFRKIISNPGAWVQVWGWSEAQMLNVYAPKSHLALSLRFGD